jgi:hypothetical protein
MEEPKDQMEAGCSVVVCLLLGVEVIIERNPVEVQCEAQAAPRRCCRETLSEKESALDGGVMGV